ncbi:MAG: GNAT family N-acetyltransferase [Ilumatobacter sp.]
MATSQRWEAPLLDGQRVTLRELDARDADAVWEMVNDAEGNDLTATTDTFTSEQIDEWCRSRPTQDERLDLAIVDNDTGDFVGEVVLNDFDSNTNSCSFRISLRGPAWYGRGLGTDAARLIVAHGLGTIGLEAISLEVLARNRRARRVYDKLGFATVRHFDEDDESWIEMRISQ